MLSKNSSIEIIVFDIEYCIEGDNLSDIEIKRIKNSLPESIQINLLEYQILSIESLDDYLSDIITQETGWLINSYRWEIIKQENASGCIDEWIVFVKIAS